MSQNIDKVKLFDGKVGKVDSVSVARIERDGSLTVMTIDVGDYVEQFWGDDDYEYWVTVAPENKARIISALMAKCHGGDAEAVAPENKDSTILALMVKCYEGDAEVVAHFKELLATTGIPFQFDTWI